MRDIFDFKNCVPMGGDLTHAPRGETSLFLIRVIKACRDKQGEPHEKTYNVALSDGRKINGKGSFKPVGGTVDIDNATYAKTTGEPELAIVWKDPDFDIDELAFYYVRVLEIPTPRWTAYDAKFFGLKDIPKEVPMVTQERAYTSPIWYSPNTDQQ